MQTIKHSQQQPMNNRFTSRLSLKIAPPVYMFLFAGVMWLLDKQLPMAVWLDLPWNRIGWGIMGLSIIPAIGAFFLFTKHKTTPNPFKPETASNLVTSGIYQYSRNPMYLSLFLVLTGWAVQLGSLSVLLFPPLFVWTITTQQIFHEERALEKAFGEEYLVYRKNVRRWI